MEKLPVQQPSLGSAPKEIRKAIRYGMGAKRSVARLKELNFDPIAALVATYHQVLAEVEYQERRRSGQITEFSVKGKIKSYNADTHYALFDRLIRIGEQLLRYGYGRVPEVAEFSPDKTQGLVINLTKEGDTYQINQPDEVMGDPNE